MSSKLPPSVGTKPEIFVHEGSSISADPAWKLTHVSLALLAITYKCCMLIAKKDTQSCSLYTGI